MAFDYSTWKRQYMASQAASRALAPVGTGLQDHQMAVEENPDANVAMSFARASSSSGGKMGIVDLTVDDDDGEVVATGVSFSDSSLGKRPHKCVERSVSEISGPVRQPNAFPGLYLSVRLK